MSITISTKISRNKKRNGIILNGEKATTKERPQGYSPSYLQDTYPSKLQQGGSCPFGYKENTVDFGTAVDSYNQVTKHELLL